MIFTHLPNDSYKNKVNKFIVMERTMKLPLTIFAMSLDL